MREDVTLGTFLAERRWLTASHSASFYLSLSLLTSHLREFCFLIGCQFKSNINRLTSDFHCMVRLHSLVCGLTLAELTGRTWFSVLFLVPLQAEPTPEGVKTLQTADWWERSELSPRLSQKFCLPAVTHSHPSMMMSWECLAVSLWLAIKLRIVPDTKT